MTNRILLALVLALAALALAGCGGGGDDGGDGEATPPAETAEEPAAGGDAEAGRAVFASAGCGGCHTLEEAGATGATAPALDGANLSAEEVEEQVRNGGGAMPAFEGQLSDDEIASVSEFVAEASQS